MLFELIPREGHPQQIEVDGTVAVIGRDAACLIVVLSPPRMESGA